MGSYWDEREKEWVGPCWDEREKASTFTMEASTRMREARIGRMREARIGRMRVARKGGTHWDERLGVGGALLG